MRQMRKAQLSLFLVIGVVLLLIGIALFAFHEGPDEKIIVGSGKIEAIDTYLEHCLEQETHDALIRFGIQGGITDHVRPDGTIALAMYFWDDASTIPSWDTMQQSLRQMLGSIESGCMQSARGVADIQGFRVDQTEFNLPRVHARADTVVVEYELPVMVDENIRSHDRNLTYRYEIPLRLARIYDTAEQLVMKKVEDPDALDIVFLQRFDIEVVYTPYSEHDAVYTLIDWNSVIHETEPYVFMFMTHTGDAQQGLPPEIIHEPNITATVGIPVEDQLIAQSDSPLQYYAYTDLLDIESDGRIRFTPDRGDIGTHHIRYFVHDGDAAAAGIFTVEVAP